MNDPEIYELANKVLGGLTNDLMEGTYAGLRGNLSLFWGSEEIYNACASSKGPSNEPPNHTITVNDELVRQVWRDAECCCEFLRSISEGSTTDEFYEFWDSRAKLPPCSDDEKLVHNMFVAAITWVYFHELGHLNQEHGVIRDEFGPKRDKAKRTTDIHEFEISRDKLISGKEALVSHVTELAADFEATNFYVLELIRHLLNPSFVDEKDRLEVFYDTLYLMVCGISLVFFRFNGDNPILPTAVVEGSHPKPLARLELLVIQITEILNILGPEIIGNVDGRTVNMLCKKATFSAALYWSTTNTENHDLDDGFILKGVHSSPCFLQYLQKIINTWDEVLPRIKQVNRFENPLGFMGFLNEFRKRATSVPPWGSAPEAKATTSSPPDAATS